MTDEESSANIEWEQKKGFSAKPRLSRRIDAKKALTSDIKKPNDLKAKPKLLKPLPPNLKRLHSKIKDRYDDDDEDEDEVVFHFMPDSENSSLISALKEDERNSLMMKKTLEDQKMQQTAGKMEAVLKADRLSKQMGIKGMKRKVALNNVQDVSFDTNPLEKALRQNVSAKTKLKTENLSARDTSNMVKGLKKVQQATLVSGQTMTDLKETVKTDDLVKIGKSNDDKKTAELILEKSGRKEAKNKEKVSKEKQRVKTAIRQAKARD